MVRRTPASLVWSKLEADDPVRQLGAEHVVAGPAGETGTVLCGSTSPSVATALPSTTATFSSVSSEAFSNVPFNVSSASVSDACIRGALDRQLGADDAQRARPDRQVADHRRQLRPGALDDVEAAGALAEGIAVHRRREEGALRHQTWYVARVGENMPKYTCAVASVASGAPRTIATSFTTTSVPRSRKP